MGRPGIVIKRASLAEYPPRYRTSDENGKTLRLYRTWRGMHWRVHPTKSKLKDRRHYFDKGITVCEEWHSWPNFVDWALAHGYADDLEIDRIDGRLGYCPENCRFVDKKTQNNNYVDKAAKIAAIGRTCRLTKQRAFVCVETGMRFNNKIEAREKTGVSQNSITNVLCGNAHTAGGFHWQYVAA